MKVLLGITGSVAAELTNKLVKKLKVNGHEVRLVFTERAKQFVIPEEDYYDDSREFYANKIANKLDVDDCGETLIRSDHSLEYKKDSPVLHIDLREWSDCFLICPASANTMGKMVNGICDNLLTSVFRAWDFTKPIYVAPAMNTKMFMHPVTKTHIKILKEWGVNIIYPTVKKLACGEYGVGALADLNAIVSFTEGYRWKNPFSINTKLNIGGYPFDRYLPLSPHPGSFGRKRHTCVHTGVDNYAPIGTLVNPVEDGEIVGLGQFTGEAVGCGYWYDTWYVSVKGKSGIVCYGEIKIEEGLKVGQKVTTENNIGSVLRVVKELPKHPVEGHLPSMLHLELIKDGFGLDSTSEWKIGEEKPKEILDPTPYLYFLKA